MTSEPLILGVARTHDVAAALIRGDQLLVLAEAERVLDDKHAAGADKLGPAIMAALATIGATPADIAAVCIADAAIPTSAQSPQLIAMTLVLPPARDLAKAFRYSLAAT